MNEHFILESSQNLIHPSSKIPNPVTLKLASFTHFSSTTNCSDRDPIWDKRAEIESSSNIKPF